MKTKIDIPQNWAVNAWVIFSQIGGHNSYLHFVSEITSVVICNSKWISVTDKFDTEVALPNPKRVKAINIPVQKRYDKYGQFSWIFKVFKDARWKDVKGKSSIISSYLAHFSPSSKKKKKIHPKKISHILGKWNFLTLVLKNFLYFLWRKLFLYFRKLKPQKNFSYFLKRKLFLNFRIKNSNKFLKIQEELPKPQKPKFIIPLLLKSYE